MSSVEIPVPDFFRSSHKLVLRPKVGDVIALGSRLLLVTRPPNAPGSNVRDLFTGEPDFLCWIGPGWIVVGHISEVAEEARLRQLIHSPHTEDFLESVRTEAAHQRERWGVDHDAGKTAPDWFWLLGFLAGKAVGAWKDDDKPKLLHHIITTAAACLNCGRNCLFLRRLEPLFMPR